MKCPFCGFMENKVLDSRTAKDGEVIRRRRECESCAKRFTTYERVEQIPYMVIKKDGRRESFDRTKILKGLLKACEKRPISPNKIEEIVDRIENLTLGKPEREISSQEIGEYIIEELYKLDEIAYIRFASVYRPFKDIYHMIDEIQMFTRGKTNGPETSQDNNKDKMRE